MQFFQSCRTVESIKALYRTLARRWHPDLEGGDTATMQEVNRQYHAALKSVDGQESHDEQGRAHRYRYREADESELAAKLAALLRDLPQHTEILLIGGWIWITGTERGDTDTRTALKKHACQWNPKRAAWYWRPQKARHYGKQARGSLANLAMKYGCRAFQAHGEDAVTAYA